jgi:hypothetical protein
MRDFGIGYRQAESLDAIEKIAMMACHVRIAFLYKVDLPHNSFARCSYLAGVIDTDPAFGAGEFVSSGASAGLGLVVINHLYTVGVCCNYLETYGRIE